QRKQNHGRCATLATPLPVIQSQIVSQSFKLPFRSVPFLRPRRLGEAVSKPNNQTPQAEKAEKFRKLSFFM
ncbi:hypothetical protein, partial [Paracoccus seriniphilus]|uniref:hypothetical protein n=1 Tax=Paracoccus seriniphilus TaxID=184748 RepID=UPI001C52A8C6